MTQPTAPLEQVLQDLGPCCWCDEAALVEHVVQATAFPLEGFAKVGWCNTCGAFCYAEFNQEGELISQHWKAPTGRQDGS